MLSKPINIAIVDDHVLFRKTLKNYLSEQKNITVAIQASNVYNLLSMLEANPTEVLIMEISIPDYDSMDALKAIRGAYPEVRILILSKCSNIDWISDLLDAGIHGYISNSEEPEELLQAIQALSDNQIYRNKWYTEALYKNKQNNIKSSFETPSVMLNEREKKILQLIWNEKSNKEIADELFLGVRSIEKIRQDLKEKTGVKSTVGLLKYAIARKVI